MGGKSSPPPAPDYTPMIQASQSAAAADAHAADMQYALGEDQLAVQNAYAADAARRGDQYYGLAAQQQAWGQQQFNQVWPYAQQYLASQSTLNQLAGQNAQEQITVAEQQRQEAAETYQRYMTNFAPLEDQFAQQAQGWGSTARQALMASQAGADVATAFGAQRDAASNALKSYGIDPSQARYAGTNAIMASQQAAAGAAAQTQARQQTQLQGMSMEQAAIEVGQKLPATALGQIQAATGASASGLNYGSVGGAGIGTANQTISGGVNAMGSPTQYAALSNPYTSLAGTYGSLAGSLYGSGTNALGNQASAINAGASALNNSFQNQMSSYNAMVAQQQSLWGGIGKLAGAGLSFALA